jgi:hypothetical protein
VLDLRHQCSLLIPDAQDAIFNFDLGASLIQLTK